MFKTLVEMQARLEGAKEPKSQSSATSLVSIEFRDWLLKLLGVPRVNSPKK